MRSAGDSPALRLIAIVGPTGVGKTALGIAIAKRYNGEIVSADSRQIYRYMDIGTAKPTPEERAAAPHHLIDLVDPDETLTLAEYQARAYAVIDDIHQRGRLPLLVGGTGQYITAVLEGWAAPQVPPNPQLRAELENYAAERGAEALFERLRMLDPESGARIDPRNVRRVIRAIEVCLTTGQPFSALRGKKPRPYQALELGLTMNREMLYTRLDMRIDTMMARGFLDEVRRLQARGYDWRLPSMSGLGYAQLGAHLRGEMTLEDAVNETKRATRIFVRRQYTWFRHHGAIEWLDARMTIPDAAFARIDAWLAATCED